MLVVGLTGGIASGKSTISAYFEEAGAVIVDADLIASEVMQPGHAAFQATLRRFGPKILDESGKIDRAFLANIVFQDINEREKLNSIVHPFVFKALESEKARQAKMGSTTIIVFDAPLLIEVGAHSKMDRVVLVYVAPEIQVARLMGRDGFDRKEAKLRLSAQMPIEQKRGFADHIIDNQLSRDTSRAEVRRLYRNFCEEEKMTFGVMR